MYIPNFDLYELQEQSTVILKNAYNSFLCQKLSELELVASDQGYEYFSGHIKMWKNKVIIS